MQVKHAFLENEKQIIVLGRVGVIKVKGKVLNKPAVFSKYKPKDNLLFLASISKQMAETIDRLADLSRLVDDKENIEIIKRLIKSANKFDHNFRLLLNHLSSTS